MIKLDHFDLDLVVEETDHINSIQTIYRKVELIGKLLFYMLEIVRSLFLEIMLQLFLELLILILFTLV